MSRVLDAGGDTSWGGVSWGSTQPAGTNIAISVRTGNTPAPDRDLERVGIDSTAGATVNGHSRYIQYVATLSTADTTPRRS